MFVSCPFAIYLPRKTMKPKRIPINMNWYRNAHYHESNDAKVLYKNLVAEQLKGHRIEGEVEITYQVFKPTLRILDKMNVVSGTSKFLLDAMTQLGVWEDDNDDIVKTETILPTQLDRKNPRVEVTITELEKSDV